MTDEFLHINLPFHFKNDPLAMVDLSQACDFDNRYQDIQIVHTVRGPIVLKRESEDNHLFRVRKFQHKEQPNVSFLKLEYIGLMDHTYEPQSYFQDFHYPAEEDGHILDSFRARIQGHTPSEVLPVVPPFLAKPFSWRGSNFKLENMNRSVKRNMFKKRAPISIKYEDPIPPQPECPQNPKLTALLLKRPVWLKSSLLAQSTEEELKPYVYYYLDGPWARCYVSYKYNPKEESEAAIYQTLMVINLSQREQNFDNIMKPQKNQFVVQLCEVKDTEILRMVQSGQRLTRKYGWLERRTHKQLVRAIKNLMIDYNKILQKNLEYQKALVEYGEFIKLKISKKVAQIETLNEILATIPQTEREVNQKEKCSAYLTLEVLHDSKSRRVYQTNVTDLEYPRQIQPEYVKRIYDLKRKNLLIKKSEGQVPRFRQQCKKKTKSNQNLQKPRGIIREMVIQEVVDCLPKDSLIQWDMLRTPATQILNFYASDQESIDPLEIYRVWLKKHMELFSSNFTPMEDEQLSRFVAIVGDNQWAYVAKLLCSKTSIQLRERWFKVLNKCIKRQRWTQLEDLKLVILVDYFGVGCWNKLHPYFKNRTEVQIRERWCNVLDPDLEVRGWSQDDDIELCKLQKENGNAWSIISMKLQRTDNECRRRYQQLSKSITQSVNKECVG